MMRSICWASPGKRKRERNDRRAASSSRDRKSSSSTNALSTGCASGRPRKSPMWLVERRWQLSIHRATSEGLRPRPAGAVGGGKPAAKSSARGLTSNWTVCDGERLKRCTARHGTAGGISTRAMTTLAPSARTVESSIATSASIAPSWVHNREGDANNCGGSESHSAAQAGSSRLELQELLMLGSAFSRDSSGESAPLDEDRDSETSLAFIMRPGGSGCVAVGGLSEVGSLAADQNQGCFLLFT
eukprot:scaffold7412_cov123-Isochrysis_galbana.AAC.7